MCGMSQLLPLDKCIICVIGVTVPEELSRISRIISELGGTCSPRVTDEVYCVLVKKVGPQHNAIEAFNTPAIELQWLWDCRSYHRKLSFEQYYAKPFIGLCISCTGYTNDERNLIEKCVTENGGEFSSKMSRETCTHLITEEEDPSSTSKFAYAKLWRTVQIVTMKWLTECKKKKCKQITPLLSLFAHV
jgi:twin BRCT domain/BRCA1 C Terminus (BRCT) domain